MRIVVNVKDATQSLVKEQTFRYTDKALVHGWEDFAPSDLLVKDKAGQFHTAAGELSVALSVQIVKEKGCSSDFRAGYQHDSFKATGFVGLKNQGATVSWVVPMRCAVRARALTASPCSVT